MDLEKLKKKMGAVSTNIAIYTDHLKKHKKQLLDDYELKKEGAKDRLKEIEKEARALRRRRGSLYREAQKRLRAVKDDVK